MRTQNGFTRIDLIVAVIVIGLLLALLFPSIPDGGGSRKRTACLSHLEEIAKACRAYEVNKGYLPPEYIDKFGKQPVGTKIPWAGLILGNLDHADLFNNMQSPGTGGAWAIYMDIYNCPDNPPDNQDKAFIAYAANAGQFNSASPTATIPADCKVNGVFMPLILTPVNGTVPMPSKVWADFIATHDGLDKTIMLMETGRKNITFAAVGPTETYLQGPGTTSATWNPTAAQPGVNQRDAGNRFISNIGSTHGPGACVVFCSTATRFLSDTIDPVVLDLLFTPDGANAKVAGTTTKTPQTRQLTQADIDK